MKYRNQMIITLMVVGILLLAGCMQFEGRGAPGEDAADTEATGPTRTPLPTRVSAQAVTVLAEGVLVLTSPVVPHSFQASGQVLTVSVSPNDVVTADTILATIDDQMLQNNVASAEAALAVAQAQLSQAQAPPTTASIAAAEAQVAQAEANLTSAEAAKDRLWLPLDQAAVLESQSRMNDAQTALDGAISYHEQLISNDILGAPEEQARANVEAARVTLAAAEARYYQLFAGPSEADITAADAAIAQAQASLDNALVQLEQLLTSSSDTAVLEAQIAQSMLNVEQARQALDDVTLPALTAGTVLAVDILPGMMVGAGTPVITIQDLSQLQFNTTNLSERDLAQITPGQTVWITFKSYPNTPVEGVVARIDNQASGMIGDAATFAVIIDLLPTDLILRAGMTGRAEIGGDN